MKLSVRWIRGKEDYAEILAHEIPSGLLDAKERADVSEHLREIAQELHPVESEVAALRAEVEGMREDAEKMARYIVNHGQDMPDHACAQCVPHADMLIAGFVCGYHKAVSIDAARKESSNG